MHALLVTGATHEKRQEVIAQQIADWQVTLHDVVTLALVEDTSSIGIAEVRAFQKRLTLTPYESPYTVGIIHDMDALTIEAQNSLLKTLEEPPPHTRIIGEAPTDGTLLPTVLSRMQRISLHTQSIPEAESHEALAFMDELIKLSTGAKLARVEPLTPTKEAASAWVDATIAAWETNLHLEKDAILRASLARAIRLLLTARSQLKANVNHRLAIDNAILEL